MGDEITPADRPGTDFRHIPALDGLRGVAVLGVVAHHGGYLTGGYLGVDLFFVLSGFLITSLLIHEHRVTGSISLRAFWSRRARRLLPAMIAVVGATGAYAWFFGDPHQLAKLRKEGLAALVYMSNWVQLASGDNYWDRFTSPSPLRHMWSLAIEEQFYIVWPLIAVLVVRSSSTISNARVTRLLASICAVGALGSMSLGAVLHDPARSALRMYYGTDTRVGAILVGGLVACLGYLFGRPVGAELDRTSRWMAIGTGVVIVALGAAWARLDGTSPWLWKGALPACTVAGGALVAVFGSERRTAWNRVFEWAPLRWFGALSYGLYLWHWPIFVILDEGRTGLGGVGLFGLRVAVSIAAAAVSYVIIEQPVRRRRISGRRLALLAPIVTLAAIGLLLIGTRSEPTLVTSTIDAAKETDRALDAAGPTPRADLLLGPDTPLRLMVVGDSVGENFGLAADRLAAASSTMASTNATLPGCPLELRPISMRLEGGEIRKSSDACSTYPEVWAAAIDRFEPNVALVTYGAAIEGPKEVTPGAFSSPCEPAFRSYWRNNLAAALDLLLTREVIPLVTTVSYYRGFGSGEADFQADCFNEDIRLVAGSRPDVVVVDLKAWVCPTNDCRSSHLGRVLRPDGLHFADDTAEIALLWVLRQGLGPWPGP